MVSLLFIAVVGIQYEEILQSGEKYLFISAGCGGITHTLTHTHTHSHTRVHESTFSDSQLPAFDSPC